MARLAIAAAVVPAFGGVVLVSTAAVLAADGGVFVNDGSTILTVENESGGPLTVTVKSVPNENNRTGDTVKVLADHDRAVMGPFKTTLFNQGGGSQVYVDVSDDGLKIGAAKLNLV